jgi:hypothetical protein
MTYSPQFNAANPALLGQSAASAPLTSAAVQNPAMTSPMAGQNPMGSQPMGPALGAFRGSVATPGGFQQSQPLVSQPQMPAFLQQPSVSLPQGQGAFATSNAMTPTAQDAMANGAGGPASPRGAFGPAPATPMVSQSPGGRR